MKSAEVTSTTLVPTVLAPSVLLQRKCDCGNHTIAGGKCAECSEEQHAHGLQRSAHSPGRIAGNHSAVPPIVHEVLNSPGQPLDAATRGFFEPRFGQDFSRVRVHNDAKAAESARSVNALAYSVGSNLVFANGQYAPQTRTGRQLIAHELAHSIQQNNSSRVPLDNLEIAEQGRSAEKEAEAVSQSIMAISELPDESRESRKTVGTMGRPIGVAERRLESDQSSGLLASRRPTEGYARNAALFRKPDETAAGSDTDKKQPVASDSDASKLAGVCFRTPFTGGTVTFHDCSAEQLSDYAVIPESGTTTFTPAAGVTYDADGFWFRYHLPRTQWFKIGDHCDVDVTCAGHSFSHTECCNFAASLIKGWPAWNGGVHGSRNPF